MGVVVVIVVATGDGGGGDEEDQQELEQCGVERLDGPMVVDCACVHEILTFLYLGSSPPASGLMVGMQRVVASPGDAQARVWAPLGARRRRDAVVDGSIIFFQALASIEPRHIVRLHDGRDR